MPRFSDFFAFECPKFSDTHVCAHIFAQILVKPLFSHLHKAGFLLTRVICTNHKGYAGLSHPFLGMGPGPMELGILAVF